MKKSTILLSALLFTFYFSLAQQQERPGEQPPPETGESFKIGMAGYTFVRFDLDKTLETMQKADAVSYTHLDRRSKLKRIIRSMIPIQPGQKCRLI